MKIKEELFNQHTKDYLRKAYKSLFGLAAQSTKSKAELISDFIEKMDFSSKEEFQKWFFTLPVLTQNIICKTTFTDYVPISPIEKEFNVSLVKKQDLWVYFNETEWVFKPEANLDFLFLQNHYDTPVCISPEYLVVLMRSFLDDPAPLRLSDCKIPDVKEKPWSAAPFIGDVIPLLCDSLENIFHGLSEAEREKTLKTVFKKKVIDDLKTSTGFMPFNIEDSNTPSSVVLASRLLLCVYNYSLKRPEDTYQYIRHLVEMFFSEKSRYKSLWHPPDMSYIEYNCCLDFFSKKQGYYLDKDIDIPKSRKVFRDILLYVAKDGDWFSTEKLSEYIKINVKDFSFCDPSLEKTLKLKGESITVDSITYRNRQADEFNPYGILRYYIFVRPLFKAYCYFFSTLGILEIIQNNPPLVRKHKEKMVPISPYDSISAIRITEFGKWCLGLTDKRPEKTIQEFSVTADQNLFLITLHGTSLERELYLNKIGEGFGEKRWRVSPSSFVSNCNTKRDITLRIEQFKTLIDSKPAPHWKAFFQKILGRVGLFSKSRSDMLIYDLPEDNIITEELLNDPQIKHIVRRIEGNMIAIFGKDENKFFTFLSEHGIIRLK